MNFFKTTLIFLGMTPSLFAQRSAAASPTDADDRLPAQRLEKQITSPVLSAGNVTEVKVDGQQIFIRTENTFAKIEVYSPSIIRVRIDKHDLGRDFSYAVVGKPQACKTNIVQSDESITLSTDSVKTVIYKKPFSVAFYTTNGKLINEDEKGLNTEWISDQVTTYKTLQPNERFIGLGEKTGNLDRSGTGYTNWNNDNYGYSTSADPLYSTIPFYIGLHNHLSYGIFFDNTYQSDFNFGASNNRFVSFGARGGEMNYYFIYGQTVTNIITDYTYLTGRMNLPPLWSLGYQQNRYSYYPDTEVLRIAQTLREKHIPADGITLDIHYMDNYKLFTWNKERFPDPVAMNKKLEEMGFKTTVIVDPGVKAEDGYAAHEDGLKNDVFVKYPDGKPWTAQVWPGWCNFPDFTNPKGRDWWKKQMNFFASTGVDGIWNDMNEPASWGNKVPSNVIFNYDGQPATMLQAHNVYGLEMARSSYEGAKALFPRRPFILTRAGYAGLQRYTAIWTGDNRAEDNHMIAGIRLLNSLGLSGVAFTGMDVGGFTGNPTTSLYARWIQLGAFIPYFRNHTAVNTKSAEPWTFGEEVTEIARNFISLRYKLMPYLYSAFYEATQDGMPVMRSLAIDYTFDDKVYDTRYQNEYLFGSSVLVLPYEGDAQFGEAYFPQGKWYDLFTDDVQKGNEEKILKLNYSRLPIYVKESSIIPMQSLIQSTVEMPKDTLYLHIYKGDVNNEFVYYEDDGESYKYQSGDYYKRLMQYDAANKTIRLNKVEGNFVSKFKSIKLILHGFDGTGNVAVNGAAMKLDKDFVSLIVPVSRFDPQGISNPVVGADVLSCTIKNSNDEIDVKY